ncbi:TPA: nuclease [Klebsiella aerogenes]|uniref:nuclease n=1 Tax=Klebsiella aerogenes TaxID=548 RepID=UPI0027F722C7|nr:nuclease [Klebsiella aerogenes]MEB5698521.1 nuclease [Klebsiella aerogenes]HDT6506968.1 nuclease [Klebsiella aerogenes]
MLLTISEIEKRLEEKFSLFDGEMDDLILKKRVKMSDDYKLIEREFNIKLDSEFVAFTSLFNLDCFSLGNIVFGSGDAYVNRLIRINKGNDLEKWWSGRERPRFMIAVAISDPYTILLDTRNGKVYAVTSEPGESDDMPVALGFYYFIRGIGSVFLKSMPSSEVVNFVGAVNKEFWYVI